MRAVIYARFSSAAQSEHSIEGQLKDCYEYAEKNGIQVIRTYIDRAKSARTDNRPNFQAMIKDSSKKEFDTVLVWKLDRFSRDRYDSAKYKRDLKKNGVSVVSVMENISEGAEGILLESLLEGWAEYTSKDLSVKVSRGMNTNAEKYLSNGGITPFGFITVPMEKTSAYGKRPKKVYAIDEAKRPIVVEIFQRYANGESKKEICDSLNMRNIKTAKGVDFNKSSMNALLRNKKYIGTYCYNGKETPNAIPRIVSDDLFEKVQKRLERNKHSCAYVNATEEYILARKLFCGHCNEHMIGSSGTSKQGVVHHYYSCRAARFEKTCKKKSVRKELIETAVVEKAKAFLTEDNIARIAKEVIALNEKEKNSPAIRSLKEQLEENKKEQTNLMAALRKSGSNERITQKIFDDLDVLIAEQDSIESQISDYERKADGVSESEIIYFLTTMKNRKSETLKNKRTIINIFVNKVYLYDNGNALLFLNSHDKVIEISAEDLKRVKSDFENSQLNMQGSPKTSSGWMRFYYNIQ